MRISRTTFLAVVIFCIAFVVYRGNDGYVDTYDSAPTSLYVMNAIEHHTLNFDDFRGGYIDIRPGYPLITTPDGHLQSLFPIGTAILTAPVYGALELARIGHAGPDITSSTFGLLRLQNEKFVANLVAAAAASLFFFCAIQYSTLLPACITTAAFALGSDMWTVGSQALWQHGPVALVTLAMSLALLRVAQRPLRTNELVLAGLCAGFLPVIRPTALVFSLAGLAFALLYARRRIAYFVVGGAIGLLPGIIWNFSIYHAIVGGYMVNETSYTVSWTQVVGAFFGLLLSPNRGLFIFTPYVIFSLLAVVSLWRERNAPARLLQLLTVASGALFGSYLFFLRWQGGSTFGPRYLTELMPTACLLLLYVLPKSFQAASRPRRALFGAVCIAVALSTCVQIAGANGEPKTNWSGVPIDLSVEPERIWQWKDAQITRDALATYHLWGPNPTFPNAYVSGFDGQILGIEASGAPIGPAGVTTTANASIRMRARLENTGTSRWYGYDTGMYYGLTHVRVRYIAPGGAVAMERYLSIEGAPAAGQTAIAIADVDVPALPGVYRAIFDIDAYQDARIGSRHVGARSVRVVVSSH